MNFLTFLLEQEANSLNEKFTSMYERYVKHFIDSFGIGKDRYPTPQWVAGRLTWFRHGKPTDSALSDNPILNDFKDYFSTRKLLSILPNKKTGGNYYAPTDLASKFVQFLMTKSEDDLTKIMRDLGYQADQEWAGSLSKEDAATLETFKNITSEDYEYLMGLLSAKESKKNYTSKIDTTSIKNEDRLFRLKDLGLINSNNTINTKNIKSLINFIEAHGYSQLKDFNADMRYTAKRLSANRALANNLLNKILSGEENYGNDLVAKASEILDLGNESVSKLVSGGTNLTKPDMMQLKQLKLITNDNKISELGQAVIARGKIKKSSSDVSSEMNDLKMSRVKDYTNSDLEGLSREEKIARIAQSNKAQRQNQKAGGRAKQFQDL